MERLDPINTDASQGAPCASCGDDALTVRAVLESGHLVSRPFCGPCDADAIAECPECTNLFWQRDGYRIGRELLCGDCGAKHPVVVGPVMSAILADARGNR